MGEREQLFLKEREELLKREVSNVENFDKGILTLSSAGLGVSLVFIKTVVPLSKAACLCLLYFSWGLFILAIASTLSSYLFGVHAIKKQIELNALILLEGNENARNQRPLSAKITDRLSYVSATAYCLAISFTTLFIILHLK